MTSDAKDPLKGPKSFDRFDYVSVKNESVFSKHSTAPAEPVAETWIALCAQAAVEKDPKRLLELVSEINRLLDARKNRLAKKGDEDVETHPNAGKNYPRA
jgi:hypothetical protein